MKTRLTALIMVSVFWGAGCGQVRDPLKPYPKTGRTKTFDFKIEEDVPWAVGPGAIYKAYTYNRQVPGPTIDVNAGDHVVIRLTNLGKAPHSIHTHIVEFTDANDGVEGPSLVMPGQTATIEWDAVFPGTFPYHDHGHEAHGVARGLFGALIVRAPGEEKATEHVVVLGDFDTKAYSKLPGVADPTTGVISMEGTYRGGHQYMHTINGLAYTDAIPPFTARVGDLVRWRVISIGKDFHTWHIHGHRWLGADQKLTDNIQLGPGLYDTFEYREDKVGSWLVHCHVPDHLEGGMHADYLVSP